LCGSPSLSWGREGNCHLFSTSSQPTTTILTTDHLLSRAAARRRKIWQTGGKTPAFPPLTSHIFTRLPHLL
jgi:hypothetical protein